jgi:hypothetical protein
VACSSGSGLLKTRFGRKGWKVLPGFTDPERRQSVPPLDVGYGPVLINVGRAARRIQEAEELQARREQAYR